MTIPLVQLLILGGTAIVLATGLGFAAGRILGRADFDRNLSRAQRSLGSLVDVLLTALDHAQRAGSALERIKDSTLAADQVEKIDRGKGRLFATLTNAVAGLRSKPVEIEPIVPTPRPEPFDITWQREPVCDRTSLPTRAVFEANLVSLLEAAGRSATSFGVMFVSIDKLDQLRTRLGATAVDSFLATTSRMVLHGTRDADLVCRYNTDTFAVLLPDLDAARAGEVAATVRDTLRQHRFHVDATGPEILVTTSLGVAMCHPGENLPLLLGRVGEALRVSRRKGRNQAHVHDGRAIGVCVSA